MVFDDKKIKKERKNMRRILTLPQIFVISATKSSCAWAIIYLSNVGIKITMLWQQH